MLAERTAIVPVPFKERNALITMIGAVPIALALIGAFAWIITTALDGQDTPSPPGSSTQSMPVSGSNHTDDLLSTSVAIALRTATPTPTPTPTALPTMTRTPVEGMPYCTKRATAGTICNPNAPIATYEPAVPTCAPDPHKQYQASCQVPGEYRDTLAGVETS